MADEKISAQISKKEVERNTYRLMEKLYLWLSLRANFECIFKSKNKLFNNLFIFLLIINRKW